MGKVQKKRNERATPYSRPSGDVEMHNVASAAAPAFIKPAVDESISDNEDAAPTKQLTRAGLLRRHKLELRDFRRGDMSEMKVQRSKLSKRVDRQLQDRKALTRDLRDSHQELLERHARELAEFDAANPSIDNVPEIKFDLTFPSTFTYNDRTGGDQEMK